MAERPERVEEIVVLTPEQMTIYVRDAALEYESGLSQSRNEKKKSDAADRSFEERVQKLSNAMQVSHDALVAERDASPGGRVGQQHKRLVKKQIAGKVRMLGKAKQYLRSEEEKHGQVIENVERLHNPAVIMSEAISIAGHKENFDPVHFKSAMKIMILGPGFRHLKQKIQTEETSLGWRGDGRVNTVELRTGIEKAEKAFDKQLDKLAVEVERGLKNDTFDKPRENGIIRKCLMATCEATKVVIIAMGPLLAVAGPQLPLALGGGLLAVAVLQGIKMVTDRRNPASKAEEYMDKLVDVAAKDFDKHMKAVQELSPRSKTFQERVAQVKAQGKTFEGREKYRGDDIERHR